MTFNNLMSLFRKEKDAQIKSELKQQNTATIEQIEKDSFAHRGVMLDKAEQMLAEIAAAQPKTRADYEVCAKGLEVVQEILGGKSNADQ